MTCETENAVELARVVVGGTILASLIQGLAQSWRTHKQARLAQYAAEAQVSKPAPPSRPLPLAIGLQAGRTVKVFYLPSELTRAHVLKLGDVVAAGEKPTSRALKSVYDHAAYEVLRNYLMVPQYNRVGVLAQYVSGREDWDVTPLGRQVVIQWRAHVAPLKSKQIRGRVSARTRNLNGFEKPKPILKGE